MDRKIWFVRHAQSEYNKKKLFTGWHDPELTEHGIHIAHELKEELYGIKFDMVFSSPLKRAFSTARILIDDQEIIVDDRLKERSYGDWSAKNKEDVKLSEGEASYYAARRGWETSPPNGESLKDVVDRVSPYFEQHIKPIIIKGENILIAAHGNSLRAMMIEIGMYKPEEISSIELPTGSPLCINLDQGKLVDFKYLD